MIYKKKVIILSIFIILSIQFLLLLNNRQKTSFRYFIWNIEEVSIGRLISISFISGLLISSFLNISLNNDIRNFKKYEGDDETTNNENSSLKNEDNNDYYEIPPERDIRDTQPTISVNYRVIKDNAKNELNDKKQPSKKTSYQDDWNTNDAEW